MGCDAQGDPNSLAHTVCEFWAGSSPAQLCLEDPAGVAPPGARDPRVVSSGRSKGATPARSCRPEGNLSQPLDPSSQTKIRGPAHERAYDQPTGSRLPKGKPGDTGKALTQNGLSLNERSEWAIEAALFG